MKRTLTNTLRMIAAMVAVILGLGLTGVVTATAAPSSVTTGTVSLPDPGNASGKFKANGQPLEKPAGYTAPSASAHANALMPADTPAPECPPTITCTFIPAAYQQNNPADPTDWGNYDKANRGIDASSPKITQIVIHDAEGFEPGVTQEFQNPLYYVSAHYLVKRDGTVIQYVLDKDIAWHAGNYYVNEHSFGIEHEGNEINGRVDYTPAMYDASAKLVKWLAQKYQIPLDPQHIIGHQNVSGPLTAYVAKMHVDAGPYWDWQDYFWRLGAPVLPTSLSLLPRVNDVVTIAPLWPFSKQPVTDKNGVLQPSQPTNFVAVRTQPSLTAPYITDPLLGAGSTEIENRAASAYYGQQFVVNQPLQFTFDGIWIGIWFDGQQGWFLSPWNAPTFFPTAHGQTVTPKPGLATAPVYGRAYPGASAYPIGFPAVQTVTPLAYTIPAGQRYVVYGEVTADYYNAQTINATAPYDRTTVTDPNSHYLLAWYNGRQVYLNANDYALAA